MLNTSLNMQYHPVTHTYYHNHNICTEDIWCSIIQKKYLGKKLMESIFNSLTKNLDIKIPNDDCLTYTRNNKNEWFGNNQMELYKSNSGFFILTAYTHDNNAGKKESWFCKYDLNLTPVYHSKDKDVSITYQALSNDYNEDIIRHEEKYKKDEESNHMNSKKVVIKYAPGANVEAEKIVVTDDDAVETVMQICQGYESIYTNHIASIRTDIEVICSDEYISLPHELRQINLVGTLLYDQNYPIQGNICIVRTITDASGYSFTGFSHEEADSIIQQVDCFFRKVCDSNE